jgi:hypothetical protein
MIIPPASADARASTRVHSSLTLSPFRGWAQDGVSSATAVILEHGMRPVMLTLTPITLRRPTHRPAGLCEVLPSLAGRFPLKPLFGWHRHRLPQPFSRLRRFTGVHHLPLSGTGKRPPNSADMAHCLPFAAHLSAHRNAATMPCFRLAKATHPTRPAVRVPAKLGLRRPLGCHIRFAGFPASQLALRRVMVPWLARRRTAHPRGG